MIDTIHAYFVPNKEQELDIQKWMSMVNVEPIKKNPWVKRASFKNIEIFIHESKHGIDRVRIKGSIHKLIKTLNDKTSDHFTVKRAIVLLVRRFSLNLKEVNITRLDFAINIEVKHPVPIYLKHCDKMSHHSRSKKSTKTYLLFHNNSNQLVLYDKMDEIKRTLKKKSNELDESKRKKFERTIRENQNKNILRLEFRVTEDFSSVFGSKVCLADLINQPFYNELPNILLKQFNKIESKRRLHFKNIRTNSDLKNYLVIKGLQSEFDGLDELYDALDNTSLMGKIDNKKKSSIKKTIDTALKQSLVVVESKHFTELKTKVNKEIRKVQ